MYHSVVKVKKIAVLKIKFQSSICLYVCFNKIVIFVYKKYKNTLGVKKCEAYQKQQASSQVRPKASISAEAKKLLYKNFNSLNDIQ